jgi:hypothetical protein
MGSSPNLLAIRAFKNRFPKTPVLIASLTDSIPRRMDDLGVDILPWHQALEKYRAF